MKRISAGVATVTATVFGLGRLPFAPGTATSLAAAIVLSPLRSRPELLWILLIVAALTGTWAAGACAKAWRIKDPSAVVIDEFLGMGLALALFPGTGPESTSTAFVLFRLFDILKPPPIRQLEVLPGGIGIMADDVGAGVASAGVMWLISALSYSLPALKTLIY